MARYKYSKTFDSEVDVLVRLLNRIKGVYPASSCGGHDVVMDEHQCPSGEFFIILSIENGAFLNYLEDLYHDEYLLCLEFNPLYETWCMASLTDLIPYFELIMVADAEEKFGFKPKPEWTIFRSYAKKGVKM